MLPGMRKAHTESYAVWSHFAGVLGLGVKVIGKQTGGVHAGAGEQGKPCFKGFWRIMKCLELNDV